MLFGDKKEFAIEILFEENKQYASILLYVSDIYIGRKDDVTYVESFFAALENRFEDIQKLPKNYQNLLPRKIAQELFHNEYFNNIEIPRVENLDYDLLDKLRISSLEDTFDPFDILAYKIDEKHIIFCWELDFEYYNDTNYPIGIHCKKLDYTYVKNVIEEALMYVSDYLGK